MAIRELWRPPGEEQVVGMLLNFFRDIIELDKIYEQTGCYKLSTRHGQFSRN